MTQEIVEKKKKIGKTKPYPNYRVVLLNDNHNTFDHVAQCLCKHIPGMSSDKAMNIAVQVHTTGSAVVWVSRREIAELYYEQLKSEGLTMALEPDA